MPALVQFIDQCIYKRTNSTNPLRKARFACNENVRLIFRQTFFIGIFPCNWEAFLRPFRYILSLTYRFIRIDFSSCNQSPTVCAPLCAVKRRYAASGSRMCPANGWTCTSTCSQGAHSPSTVATIGPRPSVARRATDFARR